MKGLSDLESAQVQSPEVMDLEYADNTQRHLIAIEGDMKMNPIVAGLSAIFIFQ